MEKYKFDLQFHAGTGGSPGPVYTTTLDRDRRAIDMAKTIAQLYPEADPYAVILMKARKEGTDTSEFMWFDDEPVGWWTQINSETGHLATDTELQEIGRASCRERV